MRLFGSERMVKMMDRLGIKEGEVIQHPMMTRSIERAQKKVEENNFGIRKRLLEYDDVMNNQRETIYKKRNEILDLDSIKEKCAKVFSDYQIEYCYLFGSYAKGKAKDDSDIDLLISSTVKGLKFYGLVEKLNTTLKKKIDLLDMNQLVANPELLNEILKDGVKIYG